MKFYCVKHLWSAIIYIFLLLIGVKELQPVDVHMINLSINGNGFDQERMIVLTMFNNDLTLNRIDAFVSTFTFF